MNSMTTMFLLLILAMSVSAAVETTSITTTTYATTGMSHCNDEDDADNDDCNPQPDRVGNDDPDDNDADRDGPDDEGQSNCWGKVTSGLAHKDDGKPGIGEHSSNPVPGDDDNETPREGVGNQREGHPSDHADTVGRLAGENTPDCVD